jgi:two-component system cell cycle sensor histidine kinase PleC
VWAVLAPLGLLLALSAAGGPDRTHATLALLVLSGQIFLAYIAHRLHRIAAANFRTRARIRASFAELERIRATTSEVCRRAEEADRAKAQFFSTMSHELRTPLNAILGFSELMKNEVLGVHSTPSYREYSSDIHGSGQQLLELIDGILDLSRIASGQYVLDVKTVHLPDAVRECIDSLAASARPKGHRIAIEAAADLEPIAVDPTAVRQMVSNLVSNAIKFTAPGGEITVRVGWTSRGGQYVSVTDDGPGIPAEEVRVALSSFGRGSLAVSTAEPGVGLGLPIVRGLAELHGGRLILNAAVPRGTEAVVILPAHRCEAARPVDTKDAAAA